MLIVQFAPGATLVVGVQVPLFTTNSVLPVEIADRLSAAVPVLVTVTSWLPVAVPMVEVPKSSVTGNT